MRLTKQVCVVGGGRTGFGLSGATIATFMRWMAAWALMRRVSATTDPVALNPVVRKTAQLHMRFGMLLVAGWVIALLVNQASGR